MLPTVQYLPFGLYVEVVISADASNGDKFPFPYVPELQKHKCPGFAGYTAETAQFNPDGEVVISQNDSVFLFVTMKDNQANSFIDNIPYSLFCPVDYSQPIRSLGPARFIDMQSSYLQITNTLTQPQRVVVPFTFLYL